MKILEKIALVLYSFIILVLSIILILMVAGVLDISLVQNVLSREIEEEISSKIILGVSIVFILLSIKCIFFGGTDNSENGEKQGILLQNENGKLMISKETIENLTNTVIKGFDSIQETSAKTIIDKENNLIIIVNLVVGSNVIIKELSANLQSKIKDTIKKALDLDVKEVNIKVKSFVAKSESEQQQ